MVLAAFSFIAIAKEWWALPTSFASIGPVDLAFNVISLLAAYCRSRAMGLNQSIVTAISFDIGIHNSLLAILWLCLGFWCCAGSQTPVYPHHLHAHLAWGLLRKWQSVRLS